jgi:excisionase family DNA binding protein
MRNAMTAAQAARQLNVSATTIRRLILEGQLVAFRATHAPRSHYRILAESVADFARFQEARDLPPTTSSDTVPIGTMG